MDVDVQLFTQEYQVLMKYLHFVCLTERLNIFPEARDA